MEIEVFLFFGNESCTTMENRANPVPPVKRKRILYRPVEVNESYTPQNESCTAIASCASGTGLVNRFAFAQFACVGSAGGDGGRVGGEQGLRSGLRSRRITSSAKIRR